MFHYVATTLFLMLIQSPTAALQSSGYSHVVMEGDRFTGIHGESWCEGRIRFNLSAASCTDEVVPLCDGRDVKSCAKRALMLRATNPEGAFAALQRGCAHGSDALCAGFFTNRETNEELTAQLPGMYLGCGRGDGASCLAIAYGSLRHQRPDMARDFADRACRYGNDKGCAYLDEVAADDAAAKIAAR